MAVRVQVAKLNDVEVGRAIAVEVNGKRLALCRPTADQLFAVEDTCSHALASLSEGRLSGYEIECPRHGALFDVRTGEALTLPATKPVKSYPVVVQEDTVFVEVTE